MFSAAELPPSRICCLDLDTFFVSVERLHDPSLVGKPVVVGGARGGRGVVTAASYEVRAFGVRSGMPLHQASKLAPKEAIFVSTRHGSYGTYSEKVQRILERYSPIVRAASIDEFFIDFRGCERMHRLAADQSDDDTIQRMVHRMRRAIQDELLLPASAGVASGKPVAKIASGLAKPAGVLFVPAGGEAAFLAPLPVRKFPGIGPVAEAKLQAQGIETLGQLTRLSTEELQSTFGAWAQYVREGAAGQGSAELGRHRPAFREHDPEGEVVGSISNERTFFDTLGSREQVAAQLSALCERVCWRARGRRVKARTVTLKLRYADFETISRSRTLEPTNSELECLPVLTELCAAAMARRPKKRVRLIGVALSNLGLYEAQLELPFDGKLRVERLHRAVDAIRDKYGFEAVNLASSKRRRRE